MIGRTHLAVLATAWIGAMLALGFGVGRAFDVAPSPPAQSGLDRVPVPAAPTVTRFQAVKSLPDVRALPRERPPRTDDGGDTGGSEPRVTPTPSTVPAPTATAAPPQATPAPSPAPDPGGGGGGGGG